MSGPFTRSYRLPHGFTAEFRLDLANLEGGLACEWSPDVPRIHSPRARRKFVEAYTMARDDFLQDIAQMIAGSVAAVDLDEPYQPTKATALATQVPS